MSGERGGEAAENSGFREEVKVPEASLKLQVDTDCHCSAGARGQ